MFQFINEKQVVSRFCQFASQLFAANLLFILANLFLVFNLLILPNKLANLSWIVLSLSLTGPSLTGLFYSLLKKIEGGTESVFKSFIKGYCKKFWSSLAMFILDLFVLYVFIFNMVRLEQATLMNLLAKVSVLLLALLTVGVLPVQFLLLARFETTFLGVMVNACLLACHYWRVSVLNGVIIGSILIIGTILPVSLYIVFYFSFLVWGLLRNMKAMIDKIDNEIASQKKKELRKHDCKEWT